MSGLFFKLLLLFMALFVNVKAAQNQCPESRCSVNGPKIRFPFRLKDNISIHNNNNNNNNNLCGYPGFELSCNGTNTVLELPISVKFFVNNINYKSQVIDVYDPDDCLPRKLSKISSDFSPFHFVEDGYINYFTLFNCSNDKPYDYFYSILCLSGHSYQIYAIQSDSTIESLPSNCSKISPLTINHFGRITDWNELSLSWSEPSCGHCEAKAKKCRLKNNTTQLETECFVPDQREGRIKKFVATGVTLGIPVLSLLLTVACRSFIAKKNLKENQRRVERFLDDYKAMKPSRYSFGDIKHITGQFKDKLGEGAFGTVYKGKLSESFFVAVKVLHSSKGDGKEFINEVGTIGRIHHINIVRLIGYCADGFRRALIYEFLPKGSLQQHISSPDTEHFLGWKNLYEIALAIAKGIEYLHQGCDQRILHFDIKPHNVLLDENFTPKISDFGLAKLCSKDQSIVSSMTTARGTMGYIAPEVFSRNFGNVSYKSDVYSFGMVLLEMVGGKKITEVKDDNTSQIYYPEWIYNLLEEGDDLRIHIGEEEEDALIAKKLGIVGLWCIQWHPVDRPSMKTAIQMLEGGDNLLSMPPNPFIAEGSRKTVDNKPKRRMNLELEAIPEIE